MSSMQPQPVVINLGNAGEGAMRSGRMVELTEKMWLTADGDRAVPDGHPLARFLLGAAGHQIPEEQAEELGLLMEDDDELEEKPEKKDTPTKNKMRQPAADK